MPTYLERAEWHGLRALTPSDARAALVEPARRAGRPMSIDAADSLLSITGGYPYAIQVAGHFAWRASHGHRKITALHVDTAAPKIRADLEQLFAGRWDDASPKEREYLSALARTSSPTGAAIAKVLGKKPQALSYLRDRLIKKGTIYRDADNQLHFITPGMGEWIARQDP